MNEQGPLAFGSGRAHTEDMTNPDTAARKAAEAAARKALLAARQAEEAAAAEYERQSVIADEIEAYLDRP